MAARRLLEGAPTWVARVEGEVEIAGALMLAFDGAAFFLLRIDGATSTEQEFASRDDMDAAAQAIRDETAALGWVWEQITGGA